MAITDSITQSNGAMYCSCVIGYDQYCTTNMDIFRCDHEDKYDITEYIVKQAQLPHVDRPITGRRRRALPDTTTTLVPEIGTNMTLTEEEAEEICNEYLSNSTAVSSCENITQITNYTQNIVNCIYDLHATGDEGFATSHIDDIVNQCVAVAKADADQYTRPNLNETTPTQKILTTLCPEKCGQNGHCEAGVCVCDDGFTGAMCEVGKSTKPEIIPISPDNEPCDINTRNCSEVDIMGINFVESADLSCHYQPVVVTDKIEVRGASSTMKANFISTYQIGCPLPYPASSAYIGISNDGHTVSDVRYLHLVHDSKCFECFIEDVQNAHCNRKKEICYIDGVCQAAGQLNPTQKCQICDPGKSQLLWSSNTVSLFLP
ncbi:von Willebrand factor D and EGF domain-containing protein [Patella vulgata]|uniref:von Willebrand factor D and EGF domain-containing protein n=1 Tax=Patella vulgata TaxID=6465 RepID=UPI00217F8BFB|nr:von Willebrand factor D and EGF domain-containing protein [Patella vulgata]